MLEHQVRNSIGYVTANNQKEVAADLKPIYQVASLVSAEQKLAAIADKQGYKYPLVVWS